MKYSMFVVLFVCGLSCSLGNALTPPSSLSAIQKKFAQYRNYFESLKPSPLLGNVYKKAPQRPLISSLSIQDREQYIEESSPHENLQGFFKEMKETLETFFNNTPFLFEKIGSVSCSLYTPNDCLRLLDYFFSLLNSQIHHDNTLKEVLRIENSEKAQEALFYYVFKQRSLEDIQSDLDKMIELEKTFESFSPFLNVDISTLIPVHIFRTVASVFDFESINKTSEHDLKVSSFHTLKNNYQCSIQSLKTFSEKNTLRITKLIEELTSFSSFLRPDISFVCDSIISKINLFSKQLNSFILLSQTLSFPSFLPNQSTLNLVHCFLIEYLDFVQLVRESENQYLEIQNLFQNLSVHIKNEIESLKKEKQNHEKVEEDIDSSYFKTLFSSRQPNPTSLSSHQLTSFIFRIGNRIQEQRDLCLFDISLTLQSESSQDQIKRNFLHYIKESHTLLQYILERKDRVRKKLYSLKENPEFSNDHEEIKKMFQSEKYPLKTTSQLLSLESVKRTQSLAQSIFLETIQLLSSLKEWNKSLSVQFEQYSLVLRNLKALDSSISEDTSYLKKWSSIHSHSFFSIISENQIIDFFSNVENSLLSLIGNFNFSIQQNSLSDKVQTFQNNLALFLDIIHTNEELTKKFKDTLLEFKQIVDSINQTFSKEFSLDSLDQFLNSPFQTSAKKQKIIQHIQETLMIQIYFSKDTLSSDSYFNLERLIKKLELLMTQCRHNETELFKLQFQQNRSSLEIKNFFSSICSVFNFTPSLPTLQIPTLDTLQLRTNFVSEKESLLKKNLLSLHDKVRLLYLHFTYLNLTSSSQEEKEFVYSDYIHQLGVLKTIFKIFQIPFTLDETFSEALVTHSQKNQEYLKMKETYSLLTKKIQIFKNKDPQVSPILLLKELKEIQDTFVLFSSLVGEEEFPLTSFDEFNLLSDSQSLYKFVEDEFSKEPLLENPFLNLSEKEYINLELQKIPFNKHHFLTMSLEDFVDQQKKTDPEFLFLERETITFEEYIELNHSHFKKPFRQLYRKESEYLLALKEYESHLEELGNEYDMHDEEISEKKSKWLKKQHDYYLTTKKHHRDLSETQKKQLTLALSERYRKEKSEYELRIVKLKMELLPQLERQYQTQYHQQFESLSKVIDQFIAHYERFQKLYDKKRVQLLQGHYDDLKASILQQPFDLEKFNKSNTLSYFNNLKEFEATYQSESTQRDLQVFEQDLLEWESLLNIIENYFFMTDRADHFQEIADEMSLSLQTFELSLSHLKQFFEKCKLQYSQIQTAFLSLKQFPFNTLEEFNQSLTFVQDASSTDHINSIQDNLLSINFFIDTFRNILIDQNLMTLKNFDVFQLESNIKDAYENFFSVLVKKEDNSQKKTFNKVSTLPRSTQGTILSLPFSSDSEDDESTPSFIEDSPHISPREVVSHFKRKKEQNLLHRRRSFINFLPLVRTSFHSA